MIVAGRCHDCASLAAVAHAVSESKGFEQVTVLGRRPGRLPVKTLGLQSEHHLRHRRDHVFRAAGWLIADVLAGLCRRLDARS